MKAILILLSLLLIIYIVAPWQNPSDYKAAPPVCPENTQCYTSEGAPYR